MNALLMLLMTVGGSAPAADPNHPDYIVIASTETVLQKMYPKDSAKLGEQGIVKFRIETSSKGDLGVCQVIESSGYARLDLATCDLLIGKAAFKKVVRDGRLVRGERFGQVNWILPEGHNLPSTRPPKSSPTDIAKAGEAFMCHYSQTTGSLVKKTKQCMRGGDFEAMRKIMQAEVDRLRMNSWQNTN